MAEEFNGSREALAESSQDTSDADESEDDFGYMLDAPLKATTKSPHPPPGHILELWQIFVQNVDPLTKVVHAPLLQPQVERAAADLEALLRSLEALLFAIYSAAIMSLKDDECKKFGEPRKTLLSRYTIATKAALSRAKFMGTTNIILLQALVLHTISLRDTVDSRTLWTMSGVVMRIAEAMGLHRDGTVLGLPPFESEIRRRIWWQLKMNDARTAELSGLPKFRGFSADEQSPHAPANVNDNELYPGMSSPAIESRKVTDMIFCVLRPEFASFLTRNVVRNPQRGKDDHLWDNYGSEDDLRRKDEMLNQLEETLETKYVRYCDPSQPLQLMSMLVVRSAMNVGRFIAHHPRSWAKQEQTPESERQYVWSVSVKLLEQYNMMQSIQCFSWHAAYFLQWNSFIHILDTLLADPFNNDAEKTWQLVETAYHNTPDMVKNTRKPIHVAIGNLCLKAWNAREAAFAEQGKPVIHVPEYIAQLRKQRESAKVRQQQHRNQSSRIDASTGFRGPCQLLGDGKNEEILTDSNQPAQLVETRSPQDMTLDNTFWPMGGVENGLFGIPESTMDMDSYFMLAQHNDFERASDQFFGWT
ncbi:hypothetical protein LTR70_006572 [Exophiala xenobiotica]|uniref:Xylanolytic transcriptional activator regulatory domain-containing protein n=1 Tax=Lithohypha guttulata TaxID=1690604 RepID=A0ABR0K7L7_9EURO|nr:hypothetical protein LTR24_005891 [Lithohypha guttulata]KAK5315830.1 hypothetical protein LTR70_006572 [Exophiala xenobiotica]